MLETEEWRFRAACRDAPTDLFFPAADDQGSVARAREFCRGCPVREECLAYAIINRQNEGIWGGLTPEERRRLRRTRRIAS
jgi:WhiB family redox-sensing transcriptional regulator